LRQADRAGPDQLAGQLGAGTVLVELVRYHHRPFPAGKAPLAGADHYAALLLWQEGPGLHVRWLSLGPARPLDQAVRAWRERVQKGSVDAAADRILRQRLGRPLERSLPQKNGRVVVAPDGELA